MFFTDAMRIGPGVPRDARMWSYADDSQVVELRKVGVLGDDRNAMGDCRGRDP